MNARQPWSEPETVTVLLTDVQGSTRLWESNPSAMNLTLERHDRIISEIVEKHRGAVLKTRGEGDSAVTVFPQTSDAVRAALEIQQAIAAETWPQGITLRVRMALNSGEVHAREDDLYGPAINRCARLRDIAHGGQIILSQAAAELARDHLPEEAGLKDLGVHRLRDLTRPERVYQLVHRFLQDEFPPLRSLPFQNNNLPVQMTTFIGRAELINTVRSKLESSRLVTLTGPGGTGKSRLALQVAAEVIDAFPDGVWLVELASISEASLIPFAIASALGLGEEPGRDLIRVIRDHIQTNPAKKLLLVLDNCEHLISEVARLVESLLRTAADLKILATSREPLDIPGETHIRVPPLAVPDPTTPPTVDAVKQYEAVRLFAERAFSSNPGFSIVPGNAKAIIEITNRLDGLPLAIELAAARTRVLTVEQINARLADMFRLLTGGSRTAPPRQQTLRSLVDWSYDLLDENERTMFYRAAVFQGGFTLAAAEGICTGSELEEPRVLELVSQLVSKSLISTEERGSQTRYQMLETVREYALDKLLQSKETDGLRDRHLEWFLAFAEAAQAGAEGPEQAKWLGLLDDDLENLRAGLDWSLCEERIDDLLRLASALSGFWHVRGHWSEARRWLETATRSPEKGEPSNRAKALGALGLHLDNLGDYEAAREKYLECLDIRRALDDQEGIARTVHSLGRLAGQQSRYEEARVYMEEALAIRRRLGDVRGIAATLGNIGLVARLQGDFDAAVSLYEEALEMVRPLGNRQHISLLLNNLGVIYQIREENPAARKCHEESLAIKRELGDKQGIASSLNNLGWLAKHDADIDEARDMFEQSLAISRELGNKRGMAESLGNLGVLAKEQGNHDMATANVLQTLSLLNEIGDRTSLAQTLEVLAAIAADQGAHKRAARLLGSAESLRETIGAPLTSHEMEEHSKEIDLVRKGLTEESFDEEWKAGREMSLEDAVAFAASA